MDLIKLFRYKKHFQRFFFQWQNKYLKYQQLNKENEKLKKFQHNLFLTKCWDALVRNKNDEKWEREANKIAEDERTHWLAKRAFEGWSGQLKKMKQKNNIYKLLKTHYEYSLKRKVFTYYKTSVNFKTEQRYYDMVAVAEIVQIRQRNIIGKWHRVQVKREAVRKLVYHSEKAIKGVG